MVETEVLLLQPFMVRPSQFVFIAESTLKQCKSSNQLCNNEEGGEGVCVHVCEWL